MSCQKANKWTSNELKAIEETSDVSKQLEQAVSLPLYKEVILA